MRYFFRLAEWLLAGDQDTTSWVMSRRPKGSKAPPVLWPEPPLSIGFNICSFFAALYARLYNQGTGPSFVLVLGVRLFLLVCLCVCEFRRSTAHVRLPTTRRRSRWTRRPSCVSWTLTTTRNWAWMSSSRQPRPVLSSWTSSKLPIEPRASVSPGRRRQYAWLDPPQWKNCERKIV